MRELLKHIISMLADNGRSGNMVGKGGVVARRYGRGTRGETLTEVLASVAIGGLSLLMLAVAISAAANITTSSRTSMSEYYADNNVLVEGSIADKQSDDPSGDLTLTHDGNTVPLVKDASITIYYYTNSKLPDIVLYSVDTGGA